MSDDGTDACTLISASCTTGWFDMVLGELWLCPNGLLRRSLGVANLLKQRSLPTVDPAARPTKSFDLNEIALILAASRRNRWVTWLDISQATLKRGVVDHSLHLELGNRDRVKFLWLRTDGGYDVLEATLGRSLPGRFKALDKAIG